MQMESFTNRWILETCLIAELEYMPVVERKNKICTVGVDR